MSAPLESVRVLELTDESAEYCGRLLAGLGADVVKVEPADGCAVAPHRARSSTTSPVPTVASPSGPTTWASARSWSTTTPGCWTLCDARRCPRPHPATGRGPGPGPRLRLPARARPGPRGVRGDAVRIRTGPGPTTSPTTSCSWRWADRWRPAATGPAPTASTTPPRSPASATRPGARRRPTRPSPCWAHWPGARSRDRDSSSTSRRTNARPRMTEWHLMTYLCSGRRPPARASPHPHRVGRPAGGRAQPRLPRSPRLRRHARDARGPRRGRPAVGPRLRRSRPPRRATTGEVWRALKRLAEKNDGETLYRLGQQAGLPWGVIRSPDEVLDDRHLRARGHFVELEHPELDRTVTYPGAPFLAHGSPVGDGTPPAAARRAHRRGPRRLVGAVTSRSGTAPPVLVGVGETRYAKWGGITDTSEYQLAVEAVLAAVADAGHEPRRRRRPGVVRRGPQRSDLHGRRSGTARAALRQPVVAARAGAELAPRSPTRPWRWRPARPKPSSCTGRCARASSVASARGRATSPPVSARRACPMCAGPPASWRPMSPSPCPSACSAHPSPTPWCSSGTCTGSAPPPSRWVRSRSRHGPTRRETPAP